MPRPPLIFSQSDDMIQVVDTNSHTYNAKQCRFRSAGFFISRFSRTTIFINFINLSSAEYAQRPAKVNVTHNKVFMENQNKYSSEKPSRSRPLNQDTNHICKRYLFTGLVLYWSLETANWSRSTRKLAGKLPKWMLQTTVNWDGLSDLILVLDINIAFPKLTHSLYHSLG